MKKNDELKEEALIVISDIKETIEEIINVREMRKEGEDLELEEYFDFESYIWALVFRTSYTRTTDIVSDMVRNEDYSKNKVTIAKNTLIDLKDFLSSYANKKQEVEVQSYEKVYADSVEKLTKLFVEMLEFKNKNVKNEDDFIHLLRNVKMHYNQFRTYFEDVLFSILYNGVKDQYYEEMIRVDKIDKLVFMDELYNRLTDKSYGYDEPALIEEWDIPLDDADELENLVNETQKKLVEKANEVLEYVGSKEKYEDIFDIEFKFESECPWIAGYVNTFGSICRYDIRTNYVEEYYATMDLIEILEQFEDYTSKRVDLDKLKEAIEKRKKWIKECEKESKELKKEDDPYYSIIKELYKDDEEYDDDEFFDYYDYDEDFEEFLEDEENE